MMLLKAGRKVATEAILLEQYPVLAKQVNPALRSVLAIPAIIAKIHVTQTVTWVIAEGVITVATTMVV